MNLAFEILDFFVSRIFASFWIIYIPDWCFQDDIGPIFPVSTSDRMPPPEALTKLFLDKVLDCMSTQVYSY